EVNVIDLAKRQLVVLAAWRGDHVVRLELNEDATAIVVVHAGRFVLWHADDVQTVVVPAFWEPITQRLGRSGEGGRLGRRRGRIAASGDERNRGKEGNRGLVHWATP